MDGFVFYWPKDSVGKFRDFTPRFSVIFRWVYDALFDLNLEADIMANHDFDIYLMSNSLDTDPDPKPIWHSTSASDEIGDSAWNIVGPSSTAGAAGSARASKTRP